MNTISSDPYASLGLGISPSDSGTASTGDLAQNDFLKLMTTQLMNQDPMQPMDNGEFLGQMAQFSTVSGIGDLQASFDKLAMSLQSSRVLEASSMVGKQVLVNSNLAEFSGSLDASGAPGPGLLQGAVDVPAGVGQVNMRIESASGALLNSMNLPVSSTGLTDFSWDGKLADGGYAESGTYRLMAEAKVGDQLTSLPVQAASRVSSVSLAGDSIELHTSLGSVSLADVTRILA
ncbi:MAG: flagellar hook assembly protein FlgD [Halothiobacillaceae bacterium]|nr:MAG: flagellar hook assembly protein FlgD [Halothiobacillaceae bacterium]